MMWVGEYVSGWKHGKIYRMSFSPRYRFNQKWVDLTTTPPLCVVERAESSEMVKFVEIFRRGKGTDCLEHEMRPEDIRLSSGSRLYFFLSDEEVENALSDYCETEAAG